MYALSTGQPRPFSLFRLGNPYSNHYWRPQGWMMGRRIVLHATSNYSEEMEEVIIRLLGVKPPGMEEAARSAIVGLANIAEIVPFDKTNSKWAFGPFCWRFERIIELPRPIPYPWGARRGLWKVPRDTVDQIRGQLKEMEEAARRLEVAR